MAPENARLRPGVWWEPHSLLLPWKWRPVCPPQPQFPSVCGLRWIPLLRAEPGTCGFKPKAPPQWGSWIVKVPTLWALWCRSLTGAPVGRGKASGLVCVCGSRVGQLCQGWAAHPGLRPRWNVLFYDLQQRPCFLVLAGRGTPYRMAWLEFIWRQNSPVNPVLTDRVAVRPQSLAYVRISQQIHTKVPSCLRAISS